jgi:CBS domain-containing protein
MLQDAGGAWFAAVSVGIGRQRYASHARDVNRAQDSGRRALDFRSGKGAQYPYCVRHPEVNMPIRSLRSVVEGRAPVTVAKTVTVSEAARTMKEHNVGALLVMDGPQLCGIFTERDALFRVLAEGRDPGATRLSQVMTPQPQTIHPDKPFLHALRIMHVGRFRHLPVVEDGRPLGIVSSRDALDDDLYELRTNLAQREDMLE